MKRILMLEDDQPLAESITRALTLRGHEVVWVRTVAEARAAYEPDAFDVLLCDYEVPDGDGLAFLSGIRGSERAKTILWSGLHRGRELEASGLSVDCLLTKDDVGAVLDAIESA